MLDSAWEFLKTLGLSWTVAIAAGLILEVLFIAERNQPKKHIWFNIKYAVIYATVIFFVSPYLGALSQWVGQHFYKELIPINFNTKGHWLYKIGAGLLIYLINDFFYYWLHRTQHKIPFLWAQHSLHHSETSLNVTSGIRHHWIEPLLQTIFITLPVMVLFQLPILAWGIITFTLSIWSFFIHLNVRLELGWATPLICGPQLHRIHHSTYRHHWDKNFAAYFPIWDVIFGTYYKPGKNEFPPTGIDNKEIPQSILHAFVWPIRHIFPFWKTKHTSTD